MSATTPQVRYGGQRVGAGDRYPQAFGYGLGGEPVQGGLVGVGHDGGGGRVGAGQGVRAEADGGRESPALVEQVGQLVT